MASTTSTMASTTSNPDRLSALPIEILTKILSQVPLRNYLDVAHTSRHLRSVLKANARLICNTAIRSRYGIADRLLESELESGWLVPRHKEILERDDKFNEQTLKAIKPNCSGMRSRIAKFRLTQYERNHPDGKDKTKVDFYTLLGKIRTFKSADRVLFALSTPGPQYLAFLEDVYGHRVGSTVAISRTRQKAHVLRCNRIIISEDGIAKNGSGKCLSRGLLWYYGVKKLEKIEHDKNTGTHDSKNMFPEWCVKHLNEF